jgi:peptidoglycan/xylan/chitin deacetylase (PgdA/CDA1 family)
MDYLLIGFVAFTVIVAGLYLFALIAFRNNYKTPAPVLAYHHVERALGFPATKITAGQFEAQMLELKRRDYRALTPDQFMALGSDPTGKSVLVTFDDSYESAFHNAVPLLRSLEYTATFFIIAGYIGRKSGWDVSFGSSMHMTEEEIRKTRELGFSLGSHTLTHPDLTQVAGARLREELSGSKKLLEDQFGQEIKYLAYPFGRYNERIKEAVRDAGYAGAFTISRPIRQKTFDPFCIPTTGIYGVDEMRNFISKVERNGHFWVEAVRDKIINRFASGTTLVKGSQPKC